MSSEPAAGVYELSAPAPTHWFTVHTSQLMALPADVAPGFVGNLERTLDQADELKELIKSPNLLASLTYRLKTCVAGKCPCWREALYRTFRIFGGTVQSGGTAWNWALETQAGRMATYTDLRTGLVKELGPSDLLPLADVAARYDQATQAGSVTVGARSATFHRIPFACAPVGGWVVDDATLSVAQTLNAEQAHLVRAALQLVDRVEQARLCDVVSQLEPVLEDPDLVAQAGALLRSSWTDLPSLLEALTAANRTPH